MDRIDKIKIPTEGHVLECVPVEPPSIYLKTIEEIEFEFRRQIQGACKRCRMVSMPTYVINTLRTDPQVFESIIQIRAWYKEAYTHMKEEYDKWSFETRNRF